MIEWGGEDNRGVRCLNLRQDARSAARIDLLCMGRCDILNLEIGETEMRDLQRNKANLDSIQPELEAMIDRHGLECVLSAIREICYDKANHIAVEWQDVDLAKWWIAKGIKVNNAAQWVR